MRDCTDGEGWRRCTQLGQTQPFMLALLCGQKGRRTSWCQALLATMAPRTPCKASAVDGVPLQRPFTSLQAVMTKKGASCLQQGKELSLCFTGHISHVGLEVHQQSSDGTITSNHRLQSDVAQPALSMGGVAARLLSGTAGSATAISSSADLPASAQSKVSALAFTPGSHASPRDRLTIHLLRPAAEHEVKQKRRKTMQVAWPQEPVSQVIDADWTTRLESRSRIEQLKSLLPAMPVGFAEQMACPPLRSAMPAGVQAGQEAFQAWTRLLLLDAVQRMGFFRQAGQV